MSITTNPVGVWVRAARESREWTGEDLGNEMGGISKAVISHWETGKHAPTVANLLRIRDVTGYPLAPLTAEKNHLLSDELWATMLTLPPAELARVENTIRAMLGISPGGLTQASGAGEPLVPKADQKQGEPA